MKLLTAAIASLSFMVSSCAQTDKITLTPRSEALPPMLTLDDVRTVAPALERYTQGALLGDLWKRPDLSPRDRSIITVAALIARHQTIEMPYHFNLALDNGVRPTASPPLLPLDEAAEAQRASRVEQQFGTVAPGIVRYTTDLLFRDLWRPDLAPRDRSLVTVSALIASGQVAQIPYHLNRAMDNGLTQAQAAEVITHVAFYVGWPNAFSALPVAKGVFDNRPK